MHNVELSNTMVSVMTRNIEQSYPENLYVEYWRDPLPNQLEEILIGWLQIVDLILHPI